MYYEHKAMVQRHIKGVMKSGPVRCLERKSKPIFFLLLVCVSTEVIAYRRLKRRKRENERYHGLQPPQKLKLSSYEQ